jgi:hypothetical protein
MSKVRGRFRHKFQDVTIERNHITTNKFRQTGQIRPPKIPKQIAECSLKRNWMTSMLDLNIPLINPLDASQNRAGFKVTGLKLGPLLRRNFSW